MKLPTLYSRRSDGKIQEWTVEFEGGKYRTIAGIKDGNLVVSEWTECEGKNVGRANATSPQEQAEKEARADFKKKLDKGYREDAAEVDNTGLFEPMLAHNFNDYVDEVVYPVYSQPKLDGIRCIVDKRGMHSRNGKEFVAAPHIKEALQPLLDKYPDTIFDGELYCDKYKDNFNEICSLVKRSKIDDRHLKASKESVQYWIYDLPSCPGTFSERSAKLASLLKELAQMEDKDTWPGCVVFVETTMVPDRKHLDALYQLYLSRGEEGQIVRIDEKYQNKRTKFLLKRKEFIDGEYKVLGVNEGIGNRSGTVGDLDFNTPDGTPFKSNVKGNFKYLRELWRDRKKLVGKTVTIRYFNLTPDGVPRFPYVVAIRDYE